MDDDEILNRGGTERDIGEYAKQNGADFDNPLKDPKYLAMKAINDSLDWAGDGAYMGIMKQHGYDTDDLVWFSEIQKTDPDYKRG